MVLTLVSVSVVVFLVVLGIMLVVVGFLVVVRTDVIGTIDWVVLLSKNITQSTPYVQYTLLSLVYTYITYSFTQFYIFFCINLKKLKRTTKMSAIFTCKYIILNKLQLQKFELVFKAITFYVVGHYFQRYSALIYSIQKYTTYLFFYQIERQDCTQTNFCTV